MSKQDLVGIKIQPVAVGNHLYLFKGGVQCAPHLLISSHGGSSNKKVKVPDWTTLHFYGPHGKSLQDPGARDILLGENLEYEQIAPGKMVTNYPLSKFQEKKGTKQKETYETIANDIVWAKNHRDGLSKVTTGFIEKFRKANPTVKEAGLRAFQDWLLQDCGGDELKFARIVSQLLSTQMNVAQIVDMDVLTVRNRVLRFAPSLNDVFNQLAKNNLRYPHIHCSFCRPIEGDDSSYKSLKKTTSAVQARAVLKKLLKESGMQVPMGW